MSAEDGCRELLRLWQLASTERRRAIRATAHAEVCVQKSRVVAKGAQAHLARIAEAHRRTAERHRVTARIHESHAGRVEACLEALGAASRPSAFLAAVAQALTTSSAIATLHSRERVAVAVAVSDVVARAAYDLETMLGEGPVTEAATGASVMVSGSEVARRWPQYGQAMADLGVVAVSAMPMRVSTRVLGALCAFDVDPAPVRDLGAAVTSMADTLTHSVLLRGGDRAGRGQFAGLRLFDDADYQISIHQAAGMISVYHGCTIDDAMALIAARSFATDVPTGRVALQVIRGQTRLY